MSGVPLTIACSRLTEQHVFKRSLPNLQAFCYLCTMDDNGDSVSLGTLRKLCEMGRLHCALQILDLLYSSFIQVPINTCICLLQECIDKKDLAAGRKVHFYLKKTGFESNNFLGSYLIRMFDFCGSLLEASQVFNNLRYPNVFAWSAIISAYTKHGHGDQAIKLYHNMQQFNVKPDGHTFVAVLKACASMSVLAQGKFVHAQVMESSFNSNIFVGNTLIDMYVKCGNLEEGRKRFDCQSKRDIVTWNTMIAGYAQYKEFREAIQLSSQMEQEGLKPDAVTFVSILKACSSEVLLAEGRVAHFLILQDGFESNAFVGGTLIDMYANFGWLDDAYIVFDKQQECDVVIWNAMISGYTQHDSHENGCKALQVFQQMQQECKNPDNITFVCVLKACSISANLNRGKFIHACIFKSYFMTDACVSNILISMYTNCGSFEEALGVFNVSPKEDVLTWNTMIAGYAQYYLVQEALQVFQQMQQEGREPDNVTWNTVITCCVQNGDDLVALRLFQHFQVKGREPDKFTFVSILKLCANTGLLDQGRLFHALSIENGFASDIFVVNSIIDMYAKCGGLDSARTVFDRLSTRSVVTWNVMIAGYAQHGQNHEAFRLCKEMEQEGSRPDNVTHNSLIAGYIQYGYGQEALQLFDEMLLDGMQPDTATFVNILKAASIVGALYLGRHMHSYVVESGFELNSEVGNSLIDLYARWGSWQEVHYVFKMLPNQNMVTWNTMVTGYALCADYRLSLQYLEDMLRESLKPDGATFTGLLSACCHLGFVDEGLRWFEAMRRTHKLIPGLEHYNCLADILGRAGQLIEAEDVLKTMPFHSDIVGWIALLSNSKTYGNVEIATHCFGHVVKLDDSHGSGYVLMSSIYAAVDMWEDAGKIRGLRKSAVAWKKPGKVFIEVDNIQHVFIAGNKSYLSSVAISAKLKRLNIQSKIVGHAPVLDLALDTVPEEQKFLAC